MEWWVGATWAALPIPSFRMPGTVFVTDDDAWADVKVFLTETEALADVVVYRGGMCWRWSSTAI